MSGPTNEDVEGAADSLDASTERIAEAMAARREVKAAVRRLLKAGISLAERAIVSAAMAELERTEERWR